MSTMRALGANFPGVVYGSSGAAYDRRRGQMTLRKLYSYPYRAALLGEFDSAHVSVWAMDDGADASSIPWQIMDHAVGYISGGGGVLVLSHQEHVPDQVRQRLLALIRLNARGKPTEEGRDGKFVALLEACR